MGYSQSKGRRPFERASKIAHAEVLNNPLVQEFVKGCALPAPPDRVDLQANLQPIPAGTGKVKNVVAVDGGMTEVAVRKEFPSASIVFMTFGPLLLSLADLADVDRQPFIGPEDMARFRDIRRYTVVIPVKLVRAPGAKSFAAGVRQTIHKFLANDEPDLLRALRWLLFREWRPEGERETWIIPKCPANHTCESSHEFKSGDPSERYCTGCGGSVYLADALRLYERIDDDLGAGAILAYLLTTLEQLVLVHLIRTILEMKPGLLGEMLFVKDGPLAFFGVTAPLRKPMRELMQFLGVMDSGRPIIHLVGLEKSGAFVEHAALIEPLLKPGQMLVLDDAYIRRYIAPGDPESNDAFGFNTYYGSKVIFKGQAQDTYVATIPSATFKAKPLFADLFNGAEVLRVTSQLRCSMYDNALVPVVLANRLVSLADVPSSEILAKFAAKGIKSMTP